MTHELLIATLSASQPRESVFTNKELRNRSQARYLVLGIPGSVEDYSANLVWERLISYEF